MKHAHIFFILFQFISITLFGNVMALSYDTEAPLIDHLISINKEWTKQKDIPTHLMTIPIKFNNDEERIQLHLQLVEKTLKARSSDDLTIQQFANRQKNLQSLMSYWKENKFPINTHHSHRQPYFIDDFGTACAVGHLLLTSGEKDLAHHISDVQNYAYIHEMNYPKLNDWASQNGFTKDELAWTQPTYGETICYYTDEFACIPEYSDALQPLNQQGIKTMAEIPGHGVLFGGNFLQKKPYNDTQTAAVFGYYENSHVSYGNSIQGTVYDIEYYNGRIYAAGDFVLAGTDFYNIAYWNDTDWVGIQTGNMGGIIKDMVVYNCQLYVGGDFTSIDGNNIANLVTWNGTIWSTTPQNCALQSATQALQVNGTVNTFEVYHEKLAIGGDFTQVVGTANAVQGLIFWDDLTLEFLAPHGNLSSVNNLETYETVLVVGEDSLCAYRNNQWYYPGDWVQQNELAFSFNYKWKIPILTGINDILYDSAIAPLNRDLFEFNNLIISANNKVHAINSKLFYVTHIHQTLTNYVLTTDEVVSAMGVFDVFSGPVFVGNFSNIDITATSLPLDRCGEVSYQADKMFSLNRSVLLPIELAEFTVKSDDNKTAQLAWTSLTESNSLHYEVQRKTDNEDFTRLGTVASAGESIDKIDYTFDDDISTIKGEHIYYRLKMVDKDGSFKYSDVRSLKLKVNTATQVSVYPNPTKNSIELNIQTPVNGDITVNIFDLQGKQLNSYEWTDNPNTFFTERINVGHLENGMYLIEIIRPNGRTTQKLNIIK